MSTDYVNPKKLLFRSDMLENGGRWNAGGSPSFPGPVGHYVTLTQGESLTSVRHFEYGVLTFDAYTDDWSDVILGFRVSQANYVIFDSDTFTSRKMNIASPPSTAMAPTDSHWYHFIITWTPQFVEIQVFALGGDLVFYGKHRNPPVTRMPIYFAVWV